MSKIDGKENNERICVHIILVATTEGGLTVIKALIVSLKLLAKQAGY